PDPVTSEPQALGAGGLHGDPVDRDRQDLGESGPYLLATWSDRGPVGDDGHIARGRGEPGAAEQFHDTTQERRSRDPFGGGVGFWEVLADVTERRCAEQRVRDRVTDRVAVGVPHQAVFALEPDAAEPQLAAGREPMDVEAETTPGHTRLRHGRLPSGPRRLRDRASS